MVTLKIIFFGLGSIGRRHARLIKELYPHELYAFRSGKGRDNRNDLGITEIYDLADLDTIKPDVAFITNPTNKHMEYASICAEKGIDLFIEKPISHSKSALNDFVKIANDNNVLVYTAYCLRFHPVIRWIKSYLDTNASRHMGLPSNRILHAYVVASSYLPEWRPGVDYLNHYSALRSEGGGVVFELSHEIDYLYYLFGGVSCVGNSEKAMDIKTNVSKLSNVTVDSEDTADILLHFEKGISCSVHLNFCSRLNRREITLVFENETIVGDILNSEVRITRNNNPGGRAEIHRFSSDRDEMFINQLEYFFNNFKKPTMMNSIEEAVKVFDILHEIKKEVV